MFERKIWRSGSSVVNMLDASMFNALKYTQLDVQRLNFDVCLIFNDRRSIFSVRNLFVNQIRLYSTKIINSRYSTTITVGKLQMGHC